MKILHVLDHSLPLHSGYTFRSQNIFKAQKNMGFEPVILTSPKHEQSWKGQWSQVEEINEFTYYRTGPVSGNGYFPGMPEMRLIKALGKRLERVVDLEQPDIIHTHSPFLNTLPALKLGRRLGIPVVYEIRAFWEDAAVDHGSYAEGSWKYRLTRMMETRVCRRADHVTVLCNGLKKDLIQRGIPESRITPVFNGVNPEEFKPTPLDEDFQEKYHLKGKTVIGFIGSFYRYEGLDLLIRAFAQIAPRYPDLVLLLVGGGEMEEELKHLAFQHSSIPASQVIFAGRIPHERIPGIYSLIHILVYPRQQMRLTDLVTPLKPLEAMAMGKALVASDVGGHKELIHDGENGLLFTAGDEMTLARTLHQLISNDFKRKSLEKSGPVWVNTHHTWKKTTEFYKDIYYRLCSKKGDE